MSQVNWKSVAHDALERLQELEEVVSLDGEVTWTACGELVGGKDAWHGNDKSTRPEVVCLCGSTRFIDAYNEARKRHTYQGRIVLSIEIVTTQSKDEDPQHSDTTLKEMLDEMHLRKIDMADFVEVLNVDGYIGESTQNEIEYCHTIGRRIEYLVPIAILETDQ